MSEEPKPFLDLKSYEVCPKCSKPLEEKGLKDGEEEFALTLKGMGKFPSMFCKKCRLKWNSPQWVAALKKQYGASLSRQTSPVKQ